ncbi:MAG: ABC-three component system middle component 6 [Candidatus Methylacidiphilales bacterium]
MILPTKHLSQDRALLSVGAKLLCRLSEPMTVSALWEAVSKPVKTDNSNIPALRYDAFVLTLDLLFLIGAIELKNGLLIRNKP